MHSVADLPEGVALPPIEELIVARPTSWSGMTLEWLSERKPVPVFVESFGVPSRPAETPVFLFGTRYDLSEVIGAVRVGPEKEDIGVPGEQGACDLGFQ